jgi:hypothetical protein
VKPVIIPDTALTRAAKSVLLAPPLARAGYLYATTVALVWGFVLSTGKRGSVDGLFVFRGLPKWAFSRGGSCVGGVYLTDTNTKPPVLEHEAVHRQQWKKYGMVFPVLYMLAGRDAMTNRFEIEAGLEKGNYR